MKEDGLGTIYDAFLWGKIVNCIRPKTGDEIYDGMSTIHNTTV